MKKLSILTLTMIALVGFMATTVRAGSPHFISANATLTSDGEYCVSFKEAGLGNSPITYTLTATTEDFTFQCFTKKGNTPQGDPNGVSISNDSTSSTINPRNGQITSTVCLTPDQDGASCQGHGLVLRLIAASYTGVEFCDTTDDVCVQLPNLP